MVFVLPVLFMLVGSFKPGDKVLNESSSWRALWPTQAWLHNFAEAFTRGDFPRCCATPRSWRRWSSPSGS